MKIYYIKLEIRKGGGGFSFLCKKRGPVTVKVHINPVLSILTPCYLISDKNLSSFALQVK